MAWPGGYSYPGIWFGGPYLNFGLGFGIGWYGGFGWGWNHWGFNWRGGYGMYGGGRYYSRSNTFYNRGSYYRGGGERGVANNVQRGATGGRGGANAHSGAFNGNRQAARGYAAPRGQSGVRSGAFSGYRVADRPEVRPRAEVPAWVPEHRAGVAVEHRMAAVADGGN